MRVGPGLGLTHRRPGRYTAAMAPGWGLRDGHEDGTEPGRYGRQGRRERGETVKSPKQEGAKTGQEALKKEAGGQTQGRDLAGPARPSLRLASGPAFPVVRLQVPSPPSQRPTLCILAPTLISPTARLGLLEAPPPLRLAHCT